MRDLPQKVSYLKRDKRGVSDILANILVLGITVTLFSSVMVFVSSAPLPDDPVKVEMSASIDGDIISITHRGGTSLSESADITRVVLSVEGVTVYLPLAYGLTAPNGAQWTGDWTMGRTWYFNLTANAPSLFGVYDDPWYPNAVKIGIAYSAKDNIIWSGTLRTDGNNPPIITSFRIDGPNSNGRSVARGDTVAFIVTVKDPDDDLQHVVADFNALFKTQVGQTTLTQQDSNEWAISMTPDADNGTKTVAITATDYRGNQDTELYQVTIFTSTTTGEGDGNGGNNGNDTEPYDPTVPGGNPVSSPEFFNPDLTEDFLIYSRADWNYFKAEVNRGRQAPDINETLYLNAGDQFVLVFKTHLLPGQSGHINEGEVTIWDPKDPYASGEIQRKTNSPFTTVLTVTDSNTGIAYGYSECPLLFTDRMNQSGAKVYARIVAGQGSNALTYCGYGMINSLTAPTVETSSENMTTDTLFFKSDDANIRIKVRLDDGADKAWWPWGGGAFQSNNGVNPVKVFNVRGESVDLANNQIYLFPKDPNSNTFEFQIYRSDISSLLQPGWNTMFISVNYMVTYMVTDPWDVYLFAHKFYVEF